MSKPTTLAERKFIEKKAEEGYTSKEIAALLGISIKTVRKWRQRLKKGVLFNPRWVGRPKVR